MYKRFSFTGLMLILFFSLSTIAFGQETTGIIEVSVKDQQGAVVPNVSITVASAGTSSTSTAGFKRTAVSDDNGFQRFLQVPPGTYTITTAATGGFSEKTVTNVQVVLGKATPVIIELGVGQQTVSVDVNSGEVSPIDTTDTKIQTNISAQSAELLPKGTNFTSVLKISPATRPEQGGFQVDGASTSENTFIIDGHEVTNAVNGNLNGNNDLPFQLVQEVQIKSSGFEAEYGGATGGVINVVTRGGNNEFHGEFGIGFRPNKLQGSPNDILYLAGPTSAVYLSRPNDTGVSVFPSANFSGRIIKDKLWFLASYTPQVFESQRTINYRSSPTSSVITNTQRYDFKQKNEYGFFRLDAQPTDKLRISGTFTYNPIEQTGNLPGIDTQFSALPRGNGLVGADYQNQLGGRQNSNITTTQAVWTPTSNLVLSFRYGYNFLNQKLGNYGRPDVTSVFRVLCSGASLGQPPANAGCNLGQNNGITSFVNTVKDVTTRHNFDADATVLFNFGGRHELKGGYQRTNLSNDLLAPATDQIILRFGTPIATYSGRPVTATAGAIGSGSIIRQSSRGFVTSRNEAFFLQDKWQPHRRLTLNLGFRTERENVPSYSQGGEDIKFGFGQKFAPRLGAAFDVTGDGKTKVSAFYGWFYDRFKYELPRGLFGGEVLRQAFFEIFPADFNNNALNGAFTPSSVLGGLGFQPGGACPSTGTLAGRIRCELDFRIPVNTTLGPEFGFIDPDIEPYRQSELSFTFERQLSNNYVFSSRYTRKKLLRAIEDVGFINSQGGESYIITNPGFNAAAKFYRDAGFTPVPAIRNYDALEFRLERRFAQNYYFNANYTYSRLVGNYSGLASSDEFGRQSPNANRFFDGPLFGYTLAGGPDRGGKLATDRPHSFKIQGAYSLDWNKRFGFMGNNSTEFQVFSTVTSGTPNTSFADISSFDTLVVSERGDLGRLETFTQTDFAIRHRYRFGSDNRFTLVGEVDFLNLFNERNELDRYTLVNNKNYDPTDPAFGLVTQAERNQFAAGTLTFAQLSILAQRRYQQNGAPEIIRDINNSPRDPRFNRPTVWQAPREMRFGVRFIF